MSGDQANGSLPELGWIPPLDRAGGAALVCHDSIFLQGMESPPKSVRLTVPVSVGGVQGFSLEITSYRIPTEADCPKGWGTLDLFALEGGQGFDLDGSQGVVRVISVLVNGSLVVVTITPTPPQSEQMAAADMASAQRILDTLTFP